MSERMIKVRVAELITGDIIAKDIHSFTGSILVRKDSVVNELIIQKLLKSFNDYIFVYRKFNEDINSYKINIKQIILEEIEDIIDNTAKKFIKKNKDVNQIKKIIFEVLKQDNIIKLFIPIRALGDNIFRHSINVSLYSMLVGKEMFMPYSRLKVLGTAAILHDIGMHMVPKDILYKVEPLEDAEKQCLLMHPRYSFEILQQTNNLSLEIASIVLQHHERHDGKGYPNGLKNDRIHEMAKIINICDIFDALTSDRPYRQRYEKNESIEYLLNAGENGFNSEIIQGLVSSISVYPFGKWVRLSTREIGVVVSHEEENNLNHRPKVLIYIGENGNELVTPILIDLSLKMNEDTIIEDIV